MQQGTNIRHLPQDLSPRAVLYSMDKLCSRESMAGLSHEQRQVLDTARAAVRSLLARERTDEAHALVVATMGFLRISALRANAGLPAEDGETSPGLCSRRQSDADA